MKSLKLATFALGLVTISGGASAAPTKCYYLTREAGTVCSNVAPSWNERSKAFDEIDAYFAAKHVNPNVEEAGCAEITPTNNLKVKCDIDLANQK
jgi:hypothetical protein